MRITLIVIFIFGLIYIISPTPSKISNFSPLPDSLKSDEPGDTIQNPNTTAYFSNFKREEITKFYKQDFKDKFWFGKFLPEVSLNHPPLYAKDIIRDQINVTFLEEYLYPLKGSLFIGGYEPTIENDLLYRRHNFVGDHIQLKGKGPYYLSKTTIRFYQAPILGSLIVYMGIWIASLAIFELFKKVSKL